MDDTMLFWTKIAAIGQAAGAIATAAAVILTLWIVLSERRFSVRARCGMRLFFKGDGSPAIDLIGVDITNAGLRPISVRSVGWRTGRFRFGPERFRQRFAVQNTSIVPYGARPPFDLEPGKEVSVFTLASEFERARDIEDRERFFWRRSVFGDRYVKTPIHALISIMGRRDLRVPVEADLAEFLRASEVPEVDSEPCDKS